MAKAKTLTLVFFLLTGLGVVRGHAYAAPSCSGAACPDFAFDLSRCTAKNNGAKPIKMKIYMQDGSDAVMMLPPGPDLKLPNCATLTKFQAVYFEQRFDDEHAGRPATGAARKGAGPCSGDACMFVNVITQSNCVWLRSSSREAVNAEVRLEKETLKIALEGADTAKVKKPAVEDRRLGGDAGRVDASRRMRDELRSKGTYIPYDPKIDGPRDAPVKPTEKQDEGQSWHGTVYNALTSSDQPLASSKTPTTSAQC